MNRSRPVALLVVVMCTTLVPATPALATSPDDGAAGSTTWVSKPYRPMKPRAQIGWPSVDGAGRWVAFHSSASNLVEGDDNNRGDIFLYDRRTQALALISRTPDGDPADNTSYAPSVSADGRFVAYYSYATDLVDDDVEHASVYRYDRLTGETVLVNRAMDGGVSDGPASLPSISGDGTLVAFQSVAGDLVADDDNEDEDVFVTDLTTGHTRLVSRTPGGDAAGQSGYSTISAEGGHVAFQSRAGDLAENDRNGRPDVFVADLDASQVTLVSRAPSGRAVGAKMPAVSGDGGTVVFHSRAARLAPDDDNDELDVYAWDAATEGVVRVSSTPGGAAGDGRSSFATVSSDGTVVAFDTRARDLLEEPNPGLAVVAVATLADGSVRLGSAAADGGLPDGRSAQAALGADGSSLAFVSAASDLVEGERPTGRNVFLRNLP